MQKTFLALTAFSLVSCAHYAPLYTQAGSAVALGEIHMTNPDKNIGERRVAQIVRKNLLQSFPPRGEMPYALTVQIEETESTLAVAQDATAERLQLTLTADVLLHEGDMVLLQTEMTAGSAYNVENTPFSTESGKVFAREAAAKTLAEDIALEVRLALRQRTAK